MLTEAGSDIRKGLPLSESLGRHPGAFNRLFTALVKAGEAGGTLGTTLERLADYLERREDVRRKVISSLYYPVFVLIILGGAVAILLLKIAPMFEKVYRSFGADLPTPTRILMNVSGFLVRYAPEGFFLSLLVGFGLLLYGFTDKGRMLYDTLLLKIPVMGGLFLQSALATFARTLGLLMQSSVPVLDALHLSSQTVGNSLLRGGVEKARALVQDGGALTAGFRQAAVFPAILLQLMATGEETGEVEKLLFKAAEYYEKQVDALISRLTALIEPVLIVLMAGVIGTLDIIIYLPIFYLGLAMRRGMH
jgi:type IV pilus assembly protein PilC